MVIVADAEVAQMIEGNTGRCIKVSAVRTAGVGDHVMYPQRHWDCGYNAPSGPDDPIEDHPYKFVANVMTEQGRRNFGLSELDMTDLEHGCGVERSTFTPPSGHAAIINEYDWLWLNRDGSPTLLTQELYRRLPYPVETAEQRLETNAYLLAGLTEFWRAHRHYAGIIHYAYLLSSHPSAATSVHFADIEALKLNSYFESYISEAFKPLGVYINFGQRTLSPGDKRPIQIMMVNDEDEIRHGTLELVLEDMEGKRVSEQVTAYALAKYGQETFSISLEAPATAGKFLLKAVARSSHTPHSPTVSRRYFEVDATRFVNESE